MSKRPGWVSAVLVIGVANAVPLAGWWWNRTGPAEATVELSEREVAVQRGGDENTSVWLRFGRGNSWDQQLQGTWADSASLESIGFEPGRLSTGEIVVVSPRKPRRRPAWVLLRVSAAADTTSGSRLEPVAIGPDPGALYRQSGDRTGHLVMRGLVGVQRTMIPGDTLAGEPPRETWSAGLDFVTPTNLHVPKSLLPVLLGLAPGGSDGGRERYMVRLVVGRMHLPRVTAIFPATP